MPGMGRLSFLRCANVSLLLAAGISCSSFVLAQAQPPLTQTQPAQHVQAAAPPSAPASNPCDAAGPATQKSERFTRLCQQTEELHALALRLQSAVDRSTKDTLSVDVIRLSDQIQALAHQIQTELKQP
jgi:hypothetical protein